jgi:ATP-dependent Lon protease
VACHPEYPTIKFQETTRATDPSGREERVLTGQLGDVMKESATP